MANPFSFLGNLFSTAAPTEVKPAKTAGVSGTVISGGMVVSNEKRSDLVSPMRFETYANVLLNNSIVAAGVRYFLNLVAKPTWKIEPKDQTEGAKAAAKLVEEIIEEMDTPWSRIVRRQAMYRFNGFAIQEWTASRRKDGRVGMQDVESRPCHTIFKWDVDPSGTVVGAVQQNPTTYAEIYLPRQKIIYSVEDSLSDSPEGVGILRHVVAAVERLDKYLWLEGVGFETDLRGIPIGRAPLKELQDQLDAGEIDDSDMTRILAPLQTFIQSHLRGPRTGLMLDSTTYRGEDEAGTPSIVKAWDAQLMTGETTAQPDIAKAIQRINAEIARVLGVEHLLLGNDGKGSLAMSKDKTNNFYLTVDTTLSELASVFNRDFISRICELNGIPRELRPKMKPDAIRFRDIEEVTRALANLAKAGVKMLGIDPAVPEIYDLIGLSRPVEKLDDRDAKPAPGSAGDEEPADDEEPTNEENDDNAEEPATP